MSLRNADSHAGVWQFRIRDGELTSTARDGLSRVARDHVSIAMWQFAPRRRRGGHSSVHVSALQGSAPSREQL
jgi:hypothetical protein